MCMAKGVRAARKEARPSEILQAAFEEFSIRGYAATSVEHIAARAGVTKGTIYVYFSSKEDVFENMVSDLAQPNIDISSYVDALGTRKTIEIISDLLNKICALILDDPYKREIIRFLVAEANLFQNLRRTNRENFAFPILSAVEAIVRYGCESGEFRKEAGDIDAFVFISPILGLNVMGHVDPELDIPSPRFLQQHLSMVRHFLLAPGV